MVFQHVLIIREVRASHSCYFLLSRGDLLTKKTSSPIVQWSFEHGHEAPRPIPRTGNHASQLCNPWHVNSKPMADHMQNFKMFPQLSTQGARHVWQLATQLSSSNRILASQDFSVLEMMGTFRSAREVTSQWPDSTQSGGTPELGPENLYAPASSFRL